VATVSIAALIWYEVPIDPEAKMGVSTHPTKKTILTEVPDVSAVAVLHELSPL
jgi:hypothetical protein